MTPRRSSYTTAPSSDSTRRVPRPGVVMVNLTAVVPIAPAFAGEKRSLETEMLVISKSRGSSSTGREVVCISRTVTVARKSSYPKRRTCTM